MLPNRIIRSFRLPICIWYRFLLSPWGWSGGAKVLGKLPVLGRPTVWITVGQGPTVLAVGAGGGCMDLFTLIYPFFPRSPSLWETARYRLKYCLKGPLNPKPTNQKQQLLSPLFGVRSACWRVPLQFRKGFTNKLF